MRYIPHTEEDVREMLAEIGASSVDDLFSQVQAKFALPGGEGLPPPVGEPDLARHLLALSEKNASPSSFAGAGIYEHYTPAAVGEVLARSEFYTAYTPYQAEVSQGTLQAAFEFQTLICQITAMEVANASMYDGASATAEAVLMARRTTRRDKVLISDAVHPEYRRVCETYLRGGPGTLSGVPISGSGQTDLAALGDLLGDDVAGVVIQYPNFFGSVEDVAAFSAAVQERGAVAIVTVSEPLAYALLRPPGELGADIVCGEAQSFGVGMQLGGPGLGIFAARQSFLRQLPGRLVGQATDGQGRVGYVVTLATREQHIRRARATSNICTNHFLCALAATVYLCLLGRRGLRDLAELNYSKAEYAKSRLGSLSGYRLPFDAPTFNEFVLETPVPARALVAALADEGIVPGVDLGRYERGWENRLLVCVTEERSREEIDRLAEALGRAGGSR